MTQTDNKRAHDFVVRLFAHHKVNQPWLENQAIKIEEALADRFAEVPAPSVTANFEENGFELDLVIEAGNMAEAYDLLGQVLRLVEETAGIEFGRTGADEVRSDYASPRDNDSDHDFTGLAPTPAC